MPWEGYRIAFNGTKGRLDMTIVEQSYVNSGGDLKGPYGHIIAPDVRPTVVTEQPVVKTLN